MISSICHSGKGNNVEMVKRSVVARGLEVGGEISRWSTEDF